MAFFQNNYENSKVNYTLKYTILSNTRFTIEMGYCIANIQNTYSEHLFPIFFTSIQLSYD